ncbi:hypothetical protein CE195_05335 [Sodalis-like symbiont of Philaenus spumarius]|nr:hypothetical protein CE195_05335 [Sodalis-like symbiont of Philaenus spumarius]
MLERGLLSAAQLDDIFSLQNLMHPEYKVKRYPNDTPSSAMCCRRRREQAIMPAGVFRTRGDNGR